MHKSLFFALFTALSSCLFAQTKPDKIDNLGTRQIETYFFKKTTYDSVRFTIKGKNDTVLTEKLYRNGQLSIKKWKKDSSYSFNNEGLIEEKNFHLKPNNQSDSTIEFYRNGQIKSVESEERRVFYRSVDFFKDGSISRKRTDIFVGKHGRYSVQRDSLNRIFYTSFLDTFFTDKKVIWHYDTLFYQNGQPYLIQIKYQTTELDKFDRESFKFSKCEYYDEKGNMFELIVPDSLRLIPFKDNVDCYYGLKTIKNDIIFKPRFDRIVPLEDNLWAVYEGSKCRLMRPDGIFLTTPDMESIDDLGSDSKYMNNWGHWEQWENRKKREILNPSPDFNKYYRFSIGGKYGVIDNKGKLIVPPQHRKINTSNDATTDSLFHFSVYAKGDVEEPATIEEGFIYRNGASLFPNYKNTSAVVHNRYYTVSNDLNSLKQSYLPEARDNFWGLVNDKGTLLLPCQFQTIHQIDTSDFFKVYVKIENQYNGELLGIFDAKNQRWLVDTSRKLSIESHFDNAEFVVLHNEKTKKYGLINAKGATVFPFVYDSLCTVRENQQLFIGIKNNTYQFLNVLNKPKRPVYGYLAEINLVYRFNEEDNNRIPVFLAKMNGKWGIVDSNDRILKPFVADYAAHWDDKILLVENTTAHYFNASSFPNEDDIEDLLGKDENIFATKLANSVQKVFFINRQGQVVIPPQYNALSILNNRFLGYQDDYIVVEDDQKKRKLVSIETGAVIEYPFDYHVEITNNNSKLILVSDDKITVEEGKLGKKWGVVTTEGRELTPCINAGIVIANAKTGTYFVRQDTPKTRFYPFLRYDELDTLGVADNDWLWYNVEGKLLDATALRYPIEFNNGLGIGMKGELFGLYKVDGSVLAPPQYKNIRRDEKTGFYYLFENQGMKMTVSLKKSDGTTFLKGGRYDAVSPFYGKYALARSSGKVGLIDSFGNDIVVPQDLLTFNSTNLLDSISLYNKQQLAKLGGFISEEHYGYYSRNRRVPIAFYKSPYSPDSLSISPALRNTIWHLMLEKTQDAVFWQSLDFKIERSRERVGIYYNVMQSCSSGQLSDEEKRLFIGNKVIASDSTIACVLNKEYRIPFFFNFHFKNNRWNEVTINDVLMIQGEKRWLFNDLLTKKVKALKDEEIDCSNASAFIVQVENRFMLKKEGIDFCFESNKNRNEFVVVPFTWAELQPYLKMRF